MQATLGLVVSFVLLLILFFGSVQNGSVINLLDWPSHKCLRPVRSTPAAKIMAAGEALDDVVSARNTIAVILQASARLAVLVESKDINGFLSSQTHPADKSVRGDVNSIRF